MVEELLVRPVSDSEYFSLNEERFLFEIISAEVVKMAETKIDLLAGQILKVFLAKSVLLSTLDSTVEIGFRELLIETKTKEIELSRHIKVMMLDEAQFLIESRVDLKSGERFYSFVLEDMQKLLKERMID